EHADAAAGPRRPAAENLLHGQTDAQRDAGHTRPCPANGRQPPDHAEHRRGRTPDGAGHPKRTNQAHDDATSQRRAAYVRRRAEATAEPPEPPTGAPARSRRPRPAPAPFLLRISESAASWAIPNPAERAARRNGPFPHVKCVYWPCFENARHGAAF